MMQIFNALEFHIFEFSIGLFLMYCVASLRPGFFEVDESLFTPLYLLCLCHTWLKSPPLSYFYSTTFLVSVNRIETLRARKVLLRSVKTVHWGQKFK